jgi:SAM-dependent methyltransferase
MERAEYRRMAAVEDGMWWFRALRAGLAERLPHHVPAIRLLDAGCGTGGMLRHLAAVRPDLDLHGLEYDPEAAHIAAAKSGARVTSGSVNAMPFPDASFDIIVSTDVLCHAGVDEISALAEFRRCLKPGGLLLLNLPAYQWMASAHDRHVHNVRRYTAGQARQRVAAAGFGPVQSGYWNSLLFPLMLLHRMLAARQKQDSDVSFFPPWQDRLFFTVTAVERGMARYGLTLPFGGSVWISATRP